MVGILISFWDGLFSGAKVSGSVLYQKKQKELGKSIPRTQKKIQQTTVDTYTTKRYPAVPCSTPVPEKKKRAAVGGDVNFMKNKVKTL